jgi:hypothetical protein
MKQTITSYEDKVATLNRLFDKCQSCYRYGSELRREIVHALASKLTKVELGQLEVMVESCRPGQP